MAEYKAYLTDRKARVGDNTLKRTAKVLEYEQVLVEEMENIIKNEPDLKRNYDLLLSVKGVGTVNAIAMIIIPITSNPLKTPENMLAMWVLRHLEAHRGLRSKASRMFVP